MPRSVSPLKPARKLPVRGRRPTGDSDLLVELRATERAYFQERAAADKRRLKPKASAKSVMLAHLEEQLDVDRDGRPLGGRLHRPVDVAAWNLKEAGGEGQTIARVVLTVLRLALKEDQATTIAGSATTICRELAHVARALGAPSLAAGLECSGKAARAAIRCAARRTCLLTERRVRVAEVLAMATAWFADHDKPLVPRDLAADSTYFAADSMRSPAAEDDFHELDVLGTKNPAPTAVSEACEVGGPAVGGTFGIAGRGANPTYEPSCGVSLTTLVHPAPNRDPLTASAWVLAVLNLGSKWTTRAAALVLDHERAGGGSWSDARDLLEAQIARSNTPGRSTLAPEVKSFTRGLQRLHEAGLLRVEAGRWSKPRAALHPDLQLFGIATSPAAYPMPAQGADIVSWMDTVTAPQQTDDLIREGIDVDGLSQAEALQLRREITRRRKAKLPKRGHILDLMAAYNISREVFTARCLNGQAHGGYPGPMSEIRTMTAPMMRQAVRTWQSPHLSPRTRADLTISATPSDEPSDEDKAEVVSMLASWPDNEAADIDDDAWHEADLIEDNALAELPAVNDTTMLDAADLQRVQLQPPLLESMIRPAYTGACSPRGASKA